MILHVSPEAPFLLRAGAAALLVAHIGGASVGLISGTLSLVVPKGGRVHRVAGNVFFVSMLAMSGVGAVVAPVFPDAVSGLMGAFTFYLTATAWATVRRRPGRTGMFEVGGFMAAAGVSAVALSLAWAGAHSPGGLLDGEPYQIAMVASALAALAAGLDLKVILADGVSGAPRIARHLWRMCLALAIAWGSFAGQPKAQPEVLRGSPLLLAPALLVLVAMAFWLLRRRTPKAARPPGGGFAAAT
ncbi:MAG: hypothetical protein KGO51_01425 [Alphaproteobacteria bacterium]|nr:hypothetical protein [Alphaproteobacteria bacterium]